MTRKRKEPVTEYRGYRVYQPDLYGNATTKYCAVRRKTGDLDVGLDARYDIANKSPAGFEWGYGGSGPSQLALALVADACGAEYAIPPIYQRFKEKVVAHLPKDVWKLTAPQIREMVEAICLEIDLWPALGVDEEDAEGGAVQ